MKIRHLLRVWWAWSFYREAVVLRDYDGDIYYTQARKVDGQDRLLSWVYYSYKVGPIWLLEDGTVVDADYGTVHYIKHWLYLDRKLRLEQILRGCEGFEF
jgi:hypothetical protein